MGVNRRIRSLAYWFSIIAVIAALAFYTAYVYSTVRSSPSHLISCMEVNVRWSAWTCEQVLRHASFSKSDVIELNRSAGARLPVSIADARKAEEMLALFLAKGVDINAPDERLKKWTALHAAAISGEPGEAALLLKLGASTEVRDADGKTPLDLARLSHAKQPDISKAAETIRLLEQAQSRPGS